MPAKCTHCNEPKGHSDSIYCSKECGAAARRERRRKAYHEHGKGRPPRNDPPRPPRSCDICGRDIRELDLRAKRCSDYCNRKAASLRALKSRQENPDLHSRNLAVATERRRQKRLAAGHPPCIDCGCEIPTDERLTKKRCTPCRVNLRRAKDREYSKKYAAANKGKVQAKDAAYRAKNADRINEYCKEWRKNNRDIVVAQNARRRQREAASATGERCDPLEVYIQGGGICYLCGYPIDWFGNMYEPLSFNVEHLVPISLGGRHEMANVAPAHRVCNMRKGSKLVEDLDLPFPRPW